MFRSAVTATLGGIIVAVIVLAFFLGGRLQSPEQVAADAAPPSPSLVTVAAQQRALVEPVVMRGQVRAGPSFHLLPPPGSVGDTNVVTKVLVKVGTSLVEGMVPLELSGEPMITLRLPFPLWRDLSGGMKGPDVVEVQKALGRLGHQLTVSGTWDASTQRAVSRLFSARGYDAQAGDSKAAEQLSAARTAVDDAEFAWETANTTGERIMEAQRRLDSAKDELRRAEILAGPVLPLRTVLQIDQAKRKITRVGVRLGSVLSDPRAPLLELDSADPYVSATVSAEQAKLVTPGQEGVVVDEIAGEKAIVKVSSVATEMAPGATGLEVRLAFVSAAVSAETERSVRVDLMSATDEAKKLSVPVTAVYARPDGTMFVSVAEATGDVTDVTVKVDRIAGGWVGITPETDLLRPGTLVVVGEHANELQPADP